MNDRDPLELRVLSALTSGWVSSDAVAVQVGAPAATVTEILRQALAEELVQQTGLGPSPAYGLTAKGLEVVGVMQGVEGAVDEHGRVDLGAATRMVMEQYQAASDVAADDALRDQAGWAADDATRDRVSEALNDAFARGALTKEQLDERTGHALSAATMGELRAAGDGVIELPPVLPTGIGAVTVGSGPPRVQVNPALAQVRWRYAGYAACLEVLGLVLLFVQPLVGLAVLVAGIALGLWTLRPLLASSRVRIRTR